MAFVTSKRSTLVRVGVLGVASLFAVGGSGALAVHEDLEFPAAIHQGTCEEPGDVVVELDALVRLPESSGDSAGSGDSEATPESEDSSDSEESEGAGASGSQVIHGLEGASLDVSIDDLFADDHILVVFDAEGETINACGPVGAYEYNEGDDLYFGLRSQNESPYTGVAIVTDNDEGSDLSVYVVNNTPAPTAEATPEGDESSDESTPDTEEIVEDAIEGESTPEA